MPASNPSRPHTETLANGLRVTLRHAPRLKRCAAVLRVNAGSHDAPLAWPGLAHFLEHLLFLGTERFPAGQGLMAYVQEHGGQVNARTNERTTDFFVELPPALFSDGLERLSDMLAHPRMNLDDQLREREVLHAEYVAWSQDATAQQQCALFEGLSATHPLRGFHAGNRDSLAVERPEFQLALQGFHQQFYQTGQMTLSLAGPQSLEDLRALAEAFAQPVARGEKKLQAAPAALLQSTGTHYQQANDDRLNLLFAFEGLPASSSEALAFLCHWLNSAKPGGLLAELRSRGLAEQLAARTLYQFDGQALLHLAFTTSQADHALRELLLDWLGFFTAQQHQPQWREEYDAVHQRQQRISGALRLAQLDNEQIESSEPSALALEAILSHICAVDNFSGPWQLPLPNPFLQPETAVPSAGLIRGQTSKHRGLRTFAQDRLRSRREQSPMQFSQALPDNTGEGAIHLRWRLTAKPRQDLQANLELRLLTLREDARQAGVEVSFSASGNQWLLKMTGLQAPMPTILEHALKELTKDVIDVPRQAPERLPLMPIRQLVEALPAQCLEPLEESADLQQLWAGARWDGLATGLSGQTQAALGLALTRVPGVADTQLTEPVSINAQHLWTTIDTASSENALLLFCPVATREIADEAAWRLLAHICQNPFYQRLRVELQLGYAVFSALRQVHGQVGIVFGVQSPDVVPHELLKHIETFIGELPAMIERLDEATVASQCRALADQFDISVLALTQASELLWQAKLYDRSSDYIEHLREAILLIDRSALLSAAQRLKLAHGGWRCLASTVAPGLPWQVAK